MSAGTVVVAALKGAAAVTAIVGSGTSAKISPLIKSQNTAAPAITYQVISVEPQNHLRGNGALDSVRVQVDCWQASYAEVLALAAASRAAIESAGHVCVGEFDNYDPETDPGLYRITQDYLIWV